MSSITIEKLSREEFDSIEKIWNSLVLNSDSHPLFSSWKWQHTWWKTWQPRLDLELLLLGVFQEDELIGLVPLYTYSCQKLSFFKIKKCELIGNFSSGSDSIRSEYLNFILPSGRYTEVLPHIFEYIKACGVEELCLKDILRDSATATYVTEQFSNSQCAIDTGIRLDVKNEFSSYLSSLGKNTRLKAFNRRKLLDAPKVIYCTNEVELDLFFQYLNTLHIKRWGQKCFSEHSLAFHKEIAMKSLKQGDLYAGVLQVCSDVLAVSYDIVSENTRYNIQLGFKEWTSNKVSLGTLMLGYSIEDSFLNKNVEHYDFLAGSGKNTFYKQRFKGSKVIFYTINVALTKKSRALFKLTFLVKRFKNAISL